MAVTQSNAAKGLLPIPRPSLAGHVVAKRYAVTVPATIAQNDIIEVAPIPPGCRVVDMVVDSADLDTGGSPAIVFDVGIMSGDWGDTGQSRTCGAEFFSGSTLGQAGGVARPTLASAYKQSAPTTAKSIGLKVTTVGATPAAGEVGLTVHYATE